MNSHNILVELQNLLNKDLPNIRDDIQKSAEEALEILTKDKIITTYFNDHLHSLKPLLEKIKEDKKNAPLKITSYYIKDFTSDLNKRYKNLVLHELENSIFNTNDKSEIFAYTGSLLTELIAEGFSIEQLFAIASNILIQRINKKEYTFEKSFSFAKMLITNPPFEFDIIFRLEGCRKYDLWPEFISDIRVEKEITLSNATQEVSSFLHPGQNVLFAKVKVKARDDRTAGQVAKKRLDEILDLIRFDLEHEIVSISSEFVSFRTGAEKPRRFLLPSYIPNPRRDIQHQDFEHFVMTINEVLENVAIDRESKEKIKSGFRFYRMGRDAELFENKFLNWWTALEFISRTGGRGSMIEEVEKKLVSTFIINYTAKHLASYKSTLRYCGVDFIPKGMSLADTLSMIQTQSEYDKIKKAITDYPLIAFQLDYFRNQTQNAKSLSDFIARHKKRLKWHIHRIYRIRCDIVHSAEYTLNLTLLCANLEYYLKSLLSFILDKLGAGKNINSLTELFTRVQYISERLDLDLSNGSMDLHNMLLTDSLI
jgi:hypothetical protein